MGPVCRSWHRNIAEHAGFLGWHEMARNAKREHHRLHGPVKDFTGIPPIYARESLLRRAAHETRQNGGTAVGYPPDSDKEFWRVFLPSSYHVADGMLNGANRPPAPTIKRLVLTINQPETYGPRDINKKLLAICKTIPLLESFVVINARPYVPGHMPRYPIYPIVISPNVAHINAHKSILDLSDAPHVTSLTTSGCTVLADGIMSVHLQAISMRFEDIPEVDAPNLLHMHARGYDYPFQIFPLLQKCPLLQTLRLSGIFHRMRYEVMEATVTNLFQLDQPYLPHLTRIEFNIDKDAEIREDPWVLTRLFQPAKEDDPPLTLHSLHPRQVRVVCKFKNMLVVNDLHLVPYPPGSPETQIE